MLVLIPPSFIFGVGLVTLSAIVVAVLVRSSKFALPLL